MMIRADRRRRKSDPQILTIAAKKAQEQDARAVRSVRFFENWYFTNQKYVL